MIIMGIDLGEVRTGIALSDSTNTIAYPFCLVCEINKNKLLKIVKQKIKETNTKRIILGFPKNMDGTIGDRAKSVLNFNEKLNLNFEKIKIILWDERLTTKIAKFNLNNLKIYGNKYKKKIDMASATIILQNYLDFNKIRRLK